MRSPGRLGKVLAKVAAPAVNAVTNTAAKSSSPLIAAAAQTAANAGVKIAATGVKGVAKETTQKAVENKVQDELEKK